MPSRRDNAEERFARIEQLMEEYRLNHEDLEEYIRKSKELARTRHRESQVAIRDARERFRQSKKRLR